jgi:DNA repair protein RadC
MHEKNEIPPGFEAVSEALPDTIEPRSPRDLIRAFRPREKLLSRGPRALSHGELVSLVIGSGNRVEPASSIAGRLVRRHGLAGLAGMSASAWAAERGVGQVSAARLCAVFELGRRAYGASGADERPKLNGPQQAFERLRQLGRCRKEQLVGLYLDAQNGLLHQETISVGSLNTTRTHPREILYPAVVHLALGFILAHNHPSGCLDPSPEDLEFTKFVQRAGELMGVELYDHLIVTASGYTSFRERGLL